ncbi:MAG TPA: hypothetical protein DCS21_12895 [Gammaproteobacteria bacterium]|nr:hypothetical protein [Gammaproteobacteria bacterium]
MSAEPHPHPADHPLLQASIQALRAYLAASAEERPYRERQQLARVWLAAARRLYADSQTAPQ